MSSAHELLHSVKVQLIAACDKTRCALDLSYCAWLAAAHGDSGSEDARDAIQVTLNAARERQREVLEILDALRKAEAG